MRAAFLAHSGFLVELPTVTLLFDWWNGELPALRPGIPLLVFSSHRHEDHFKPEIFALNAQAFLLGKDISLSARNRVRWGLSDETADKCTVLGGGEAVSPLPGVRVEALPSTDEGVAFLVTADGTAVFHAGDLRAGRRSPARPVSAGQRHPPDGAEPGQLGPVGGDRRTLLFPGGK